MEGHREGHHEGRRGRGRSLLRLPAGRVHNFSRWRDKQKAPRGDGRNSEARDEHGKVPRVLLHEKIHRRPKKDGFLHHERDEKARKGQPADENHMEERVCQNPGRVSGTRSSRAEESETTITCFRKTTRAFSG